MADKAFNKFMGMDIVPKQWRIIIESEKVGFVNGRFGSVMLVKIVDGQTGQFLYEGVIFVEYRGVINLVVDIEDPENFKIACVSQLRHAVIDPIYLNQIWANGVPDIFDPEVQAHMGVVLTELPRGFTPGTDILTSEAEKETQRKVEFVAEIGNLNANSANTGTSPILVVSTATKLPSDRKQGTNEKIREVLWLSPAEILQQVNLCCFSMSGLWVFMRWCCGSQYPVWQNVGKKFVEAFLALGREG